MKNVFLYSDGGCRPNPGRGGYGSILIYNGVRKELSGGFRHTTNNRMEMMGVIVGLETLKEPCNVIILSDSKYVIEAFSKGWVFGWKRKNFVEKGGKLRKNHDLWNRLIHLASYHNCQWNWIKGHSENPENERCDRLATLAINMDSLPDDNGMI